MIADLIGTSAQSFRIGKRLITFYSGDESPLITPPTPIDLFRTGDRYFQSGKNGEWTFDGSVWVYRGEQIIEEEKNYNFEAEKFKIYPVDCSSSEILVTPPNNPHAGINFTIIDSRYNARNNFIRVLTSTQLLYANSDDLVINSNGANVVLTYISADVGWVCK